jgi:hypothetical protein
VDSTTIIRIVAGCLFLAVLAVGIVYIAFLSRVLSKCSQSSRTMQPGMAWLLLVPLVNIIWNFLVVSALAKSLGNEFRLRNIPLSDPEPGKGLGIAMCVCAACGIVPILNIVAIIPHLVLWIVYWVKIADFSRRLVPTTTGHPPHPG